MLEIVLASPRTLSNMPQKTMSEKTTTGTARLATDWLTRLGVWGFAFFFIKGLLWLIVPAALVYFGIDW